jgi:transcriptional regulator with XRE-family HTH domain
LSSFEKQLIDAVRRKREAQGLSLRALASEVGVSFSTLARIERGDGQPDNNSRIRLIEWLGEDAEAAGIGFDRVALVHFRAMKNVRSGTVRHLLAAADCIKRERVSDSRDASPPQAPSHEPVALSKDELESIAEKFRADLGIAKDGPVDSLMLDVEGIEVIRLRESDCLDRKTIALLSGEAAGEWSAMSVPLDLDEDRWAVLLNDTHGVERQRVTLLEEYWHILLGHKLTKVARIAEAYGRTYDKVEEHDAYYLASATLLPKRAVTAAVAEKQVSTEIGRRFGTSSELVDYRIKRLGLWREHVGKRVALNSDG